MNSEKVYAIAFSHITGMGAVRIGRLRSYFPSLEEAWHAPEAELLRALHDEQITNLLIAQRSTFDIEAALALIEKERISVVMRDDEDYPQSLETIYDPPFLLYYRGLLPAQERELLTVVGARKATPYGLQCTHRLIGPVASSGIGIVSGLAYGIDSAAHQCALKYKGYTIAVLGTGIDQASMYPAAHRSLAERIIETGGCVMSEFPPRTGAQKKHFPLRNRIIAGLSRAILVVEAAARSGSLITATYALESSRVVCAVPGPLTSPLSMGTNQLLKSGAHVITDAADILLLYGIDGVSDLLKHEARHPQLEDIEIRVLSTIGAEPSHLDEIIRSAKLDTRIVTSTLMMLEMKGVIRSYDRMYYGKIE
ncbi:DNA-protecting protein DprA [Candidatus Uhrbacteria bacterium]|nr:DNA-protecting protein DprA [Candidatus Uhrbacteria bacterium]